jgi:hypothetical protein
MSDEYIFFRKDNLLFDKDNENTMDISGKIIEVHGKIMSGRYGSNVPSDEVRKSKNVNF